MGLLYYCRILTTIFFLFCSALKAKEVKDESESKGGLVENNEGCKVSIELYHSHLNNTLST